MTMELRDLPPRTDPKGGSPKTPMPIPSRQYQEIEYHGHTANGTIWKVSTSGLAGLFIGMTVAWFTALQSKGVTQSELQTYVKEFSARDRELITLQQSNQDRQIGELQGKSERAFDQLKAIGEKHVAYDSELSDLKNKVDLLTNYLDELRKSKR